MPVQPDGMRYFHSCPPEMDYSDPEKAINKGKRKDHRDENITTYSKQEMKDMPSFRSNRKGIKAVGKGEPTTVTP